ncbi:dynamin family protein [Bacillus sp. DJP31]|uniref:dynamin family protein n=1 Tax=Bacillus sp. DJP31 TaxID=3409789 RepID=UPI003BB5075E
MKSQLVSSFLDDIQKLGINTKVPSLEYVPVLFFTDVCMDYLKSTTFQQQSGVKFEHISRNDITVDEQEFLILILGDHELDRADIRLIKSLLQSNVKIVPLLLLSNQFFDIPEGEIFNYGQYIDSLNRLYGKMFHTVAFKEQDIYKGAPEVMEYFQALKDIKHLMRVKNELKVYQEEFVSFQFSLLEATEETSNFFELGIMTNLEKDISRLLLQIEKAINNKYNGIFNEQKGIFTLIQRENLRKVTVHRYPNIGSSWIAAQFGIEFLDVSTQIKSFIKEMKASEANSLFHELIEETEKALHFATNISILGTFSAGKTTFINTLLGANLRTSSTHNTSILSEIRYSADNTNKVIFDYKPTVRLEIMQPDQEQDYAIISPVNAIVEEVVDISGLKTIIMKKKDEALSFYVGGKKLLPNVKPGTQIFQDELLTEGKNPTVSQVHSFNLYSIEEIKSLIQLLDIGTLQNAKLSIQRNGGIELLVNKDKIKDFLVRLKGIAKSRNDNIFLDNLVGNEFVDIRRVTLSAHVVSSQLVEEIVLDEAGWETFQGTDLDKGYAESPQCYLLLNKAVVYLQNDFLQLTNIIDTPGLGSITDLHDEITESYLRDAKGILMIMIKMDMHLEKESLWKLLSLLNSVYKNKSRDHVYFFCNWFRNLRKWQDIERVFSNLRNILTDFGFKKENIFLCNLESVIKHGIEDEYLGDFPSYGLLREKLKMDIGKLGPMHHLSRLNEKWRSHLHTKLHNQEETLLQLKLDFKDKIFRKEKLLQKRIELESLSPDANNVFRQLGEVEEIAHSITYRLDTKKSWKESVDLLVEAVEAINKMYLDDDILHEIEMNMLEIKFSLSALDIKEPIPELPEPHLRSIPYEQLRKMMQTIIDEWPPLTFSFGKYRDYKRWDIQDWLKEQIEMLKKSFQQYYNEAFQLFTFYKEMVIKGITKEYEMLNRASDVDIIRIQSLIHDIKEHVIPAWNKISQNIYQLQLARERNEYN